MVKREPPNFGAIATFGVKDGISATVEKAIARERWWNALTPKEREEVLMDAGISERQISQKKGLPWFLLDEGDRSRITQD